MRGRSAGWVLACLAAVAVGGAAASWVRGPRTELAGGVDLGRLPAGVSRDRLNVLLVTLDTTRADRLSPYGYRDVETPTLERLAREGVLFERAMTAAPITLPAHSSLFTGKFPPEHGVRDNGGFFLAPEQVTLAEVFRQAGFRTGGFVAAYVLDRKWGVDQGFDTYVDDFDLTKVRGVSLGNIQRPANEVVDRALTWLDEVRDGRFFGWLHFYDPHTPYEPPEPYRSRYPHRPYIGELAWTDAQLGRVLQALEARGLLDRTIVAVIGDHGESLGDHGEGTHGFFVYESVTHVPFIVRAPFGKTAGRRVPDVVRSVDLMPTLLDLAGLTPPAAISGRSVVPLMTGASRALNLEGYAEAMYPLHHYGWSDLRALRAGRYKLIAAPRPELYDLERDPGERTNIFDDRRQLGEGLLARLAERERGFARAGAASSASPDVDPDVRAKLAALGYVGSFVATATDDRTGLADPKDKIGLFNTMTSARDLSKGDDSVAEVTRMLRSIVAEDPKVVDAWFMLGNECYKARKYEEAVGYFRKALALKPDYDLAVINLANTYRMLGDDEAALAGYEHYLAIDAKNAYVRYQIGEIWLDRNDLARAEQNFRDALAIDARVAPARNALGVLAYRRGEVESATRQIREAIALKADVRLAHFNLGVIAEEGGAAGTAVEEYRKELELHPDSYRTAFNLGRLLGRQGDRDAEIRLFRQSLEINPRFSEGHLLLAKTYLDRGELDEAARSARKGLELSPASGMAPLGHYVLADIYNRQGRADAAAQEVARGRALEAEGKARPRSSASGS